MKRIVVVLLILCALLIASLAWKATRINAVAVVLSEVDRGDVKATVSNTRAGTVNACSRAKLAPILGGQIASLPVKEGDTVVADQILLELWNADIRAQALVAEQEKHAAEARVIEACTAADVAKREANRAERMRAQGMTSEEHADIASGSALAKQAACTAMRDMVKVSDAQIKLAEARLEQTIVRAPFAGTVAEINGELGEVVIPSPVGVATLPAIDLIDSSCIYVTAPIDEVDAPGIRAGMKAAVTLDAFPGQSFPATVRRVSPYVLDREKQARTVDIEAEFDNPSDSLLPGYSADVEVILDMHKSVLNVPTRAVLNEKTVLLLRPDGVLQEKSISTGLRNWQITEVIDGLRENDAIVLSIDREGVVAGANAVIESRLSGESENDQ